MKKKKKHKQTKKKGRHSLLVRKRKEKRRKRWEVEVSKREMERKKGEKLRLDTVDVVVDVELAWVALDRVDEEGLGKLGAGAGGQLEVAVHDDDGTAGRGVGLHVARERLGLARRQRLELRGDVGRALHALTGERQQRVCAIQARKTRTVPVELRIVVRHEGVAQLVHVHFFVFQKKVCFKLQKREKKGKAFNPSQKEKVKKKKAIHIEDDEMQPRRLSTTLPLSWSATMTLTTSFPSSSRTVTSPMT